MSILVTLNTFIFLKICPVCTFTLKLTMIPWVWHG